MRSEGHILRGVVLAIVLGGLLLPISLGLWETTRAAFGILPALGYDSVSLDPWRQLLALPGFWTSLRLTIITGVSSTLLALALALGFCALVHGRMSPAVGARWLTPFLAVPHAAMAIGLAFLLAPSGWIARLVSPLIGLDRPLDLATVNDGWGLALTVGLLVKEVPFFLLVMLSALTQLPVRAHLAAGRALGYGRGVVWIKIIIPQVWPLIRLPTYVVLVYALSVVDMAVILGPSNPPTLAVAMTRWSTDADPVLMLPASAAGLLHAVLALGGIALWRLGEVMAASAGRWWIRRGGRGSSAEPALRLATILIVALMILGALAIVSLLVWSLAWRWSFPQFLPESWSLRLWSEPGRGWGPAFLVTLLLGLVTTALSLILAVAWLESEDRAGRGRARWAEALIYLPLLVPQVAFLFGLNVAFLRLGLSGGFASVVWAQALFVFSYVMIALSDPWRSLDARLVSSAAALGATPLRRLVSVKLPVLLRPVLTAAAIGFAVSVAQYLPTLIMGAGRVATLTTEAVTLSSGADRRVVGVYATLQSLLPLTAYALAFLIPAALHRNRRALSGAAVA